MRHPPLTLIVVCPQLMAQSPGIYQSLEREVRKSMGRSKGTVNSASGMTASLAINYCERLGLPYRVSAEGGFYFVERTT
jgi:hypothetical protein